MRCLDKHASLNFIEPRHKPTVALGNIEDHKASQTLDPPGPFPKRVGICVTVTFPKGEFVVYGHSSDHQSSGILTIPRDQHLSSQTTYLGEKKKKERNNRNTAAKSLKLCPTLCDPIDNSPSGSPIPGILQAKTLEWVAIYSPMQESEKWKWSCSVISNP